MKWRGKAPAGPGPAADPLPPGPGGSEAGTERRCRGTAIVSRGRRPWCWCPSPGPRGRRWGRCPRDGESRQEPSVGAEAVASAALASSAPPKPGGERPRPGLGYSGR